MAGEWKHGLFGCFGDFSSCILATFVPCYVAGKNAEFVDKNCLLCGLATLCEPVGCITRAMTRREIRDKFSIEGSFVMDLLIHGFCACCALVQETQEIKGSGEMRR